VTGLVQSSLEISANDEVTSAPAAPKNLGKKFAAPTTRPPPEHLFGTLLQDTIIDKVDFHQQQLEAAMSLLYLP